MEKCLTMGVINLSTVDSDGPSDVQCPADVFFRTRRGWFWRWGMSDVSSSSQADCPV